MVYNLTCCCLRCSWRKYQWVYGLLVTNADNADSALGQSSVTLIATECSPNIITFSQASIIRIEGHRIMDEFSLKTLLRSTLYNSRLGGWAPIKSRGWSSGIFFLPLRGTKKGLVQALFNPLKGAKPAAHGIGNARFVLKASFPVFFTSLAQEPLSRSASTPHVTVWCLTP